MYYVESKKESQAHKKEDNEGLKTYKTKTMTSQRK